MDKPKSSKEIAHATTWAFTTELISKMIMPVINMILARILVPEDFGVVAIINMVLNFSDIFAVAGLQKYIVQHKYKDNDELNKSLSVAFWTNLVFSIILWLAIVLFQNQIVQLIGNPSLGKAIAIACLSLPIKSLSCAQEALCIRNFQFKRLFNNRLLASLTPLLVTVPLALLGLGYWSLVIGNLASDLIKTLYLNLSSSWKPKLYFNYMHLTKMLSFGIWALLESLSLWGCIWFDIFIISNSMGEYYTGIYRTAQSTITGIFALFTAGTASVLYSSLSRVQDDKIKFNQLYYTFQKNLSLIVLPVGVGMFVYKGFITRVLLGNQWNDAINLIGIWGLCTALVSTYGTLTRETYRAKGLPHVSVIVQAVHLLFVVPVSIIGLRFGFENYIYIRSIAFLQIIVLHFIALKKIIGVSPLKLLRQTTIPIAGSVLMGVVGFIYLRFGSGMLFSTLGVLICGICYVAFLALFPSYRAKGIHFFRVAICKINR